MGTLLQAVNLNIYNMDRGLPAEFVDYFVDRIRYLSLEACKKKFAEFALAYEKLVTNVPNISIELKSEEVNIFLK